MKSAYVSINVPVMGPRHRLARKLRAIEMVPETRRLEEQTQVEVGGSCAVDAALAGEQARDRREHLCEGAFELDQPSERDIRFDDGDEDVLIA